jgi:HSP20 family protein
MSYWEKDFDEFVKRFMNMSKRNSFSGDSFFSNDLGDIRRDIEQIFSKHLHDLQSNPPKELVREYENEQGSKIREIGPFVYGYSVTIGSDGRPQIREFGNVRKRFLSPSGVDETRVSSREPLIDIINNDREVKVLVELPGANKENIRINAYDNSIEISAEDERKYHQIVELPEGLDIDNARSSYKNGILEIILPKKTKDFPRRKKIRID